MSTRSRFSRQKKTLLQPHRQHGLGPFSVAPLQQLDAIDVVANLNQVSHMELGTPPFCPSCHFTAAHHIGLCQDGWVESPSADTGIYLQLDTRFKLSSNLNILYIRHVPSVSPVAAGVLYNNVVILVNATYCSSGRKRLKHAVSPSTVAMLERLNNLEV